MDVDSSGSDSIVLPRVSPVLVVAAVAAAISASAAYLRQRDSAADLHTKVSLVQGVAEDYTRRFGFDQRPSYLERNVERYGIAERHHRISFGRWYESTLSTFGEGPLVPPVDGDFAFRVVEASVSRKAMVRFQTRLDGRLTFRAVAIDLSRHPRPNVESPVLNRAGLLTLDESIRIRDMALSAAREFRRRSTIDLPGADGFSLYAEIVDGRGSTFMAPWSPDEDDLPALFLLRRRVFEVTGIWRPLEIRAAFVIPTPWYPSRTGQRCEWPLLVAGGRDEDERLEAAILWMNRRYGGPVTVTSRSAFCWRSAGLLPHYGIGRHLVLDTVDRRRGERVTRFVRLLSPGLRSRHFLQAWDEDWRGRWYLAPENLGEDN